MNNFVLLVERSDEMLKKCLYFFYYTFLLSLSLSLSSYPLPLSSSPISGAVDLATNLTCRCPCLSHHLPLSQYQPLSLSPFHLSLYFKQTYWFRLGLWVSWFFFFFFRLWWVLGGEDVLCFFFFFFSLVVLGLFNFLWWLFIFFLQFGLVVRLFFVANLVGIWNIIENNFKNLCISDFVFVFFFFLLWYQYI